MLTTWAPESDDASVFTVRRQDRGSRSSGLQMRLALIRLMIRQIYGGWLGRLVNKLSKSRRSFACRALDNGIGKANWRKIACCGDVACERLNICRKPPENSVIKKKSADFPGALPSSKTGCPLLFEWRSQPWCKQHCWPARVRAFLRTARSARACPPIFCGVSATRSEVVDADGVVEKVVEMYIHLRRRVEGYVVNFVVDDVLGNDGSGNGRETETAVYVNPVGPGVAVSKRSAWLPEIRLATITLLAKVSPGAWL